MRRSRFEISKRKPLGTFGMSSVRQKIDGYDLRLGLAHNFVTPNEPVTVRFVYPHRRDVNDVVACNEAESEDTTGEELGAG